MFITPWIRNFIELALQEDIGTGDVTSELTVPPDKKGLAHIISREEGVLAGLDICREVFHIIDRRLDFAEKAVDGDLIEKGAVIAVISGCVRPIMIAERTALNFLQHLSGISTLTRRWAELIADYDCELVDTRKTTPGMRQMEKYAVRVGGARNHRLGLSGGILIKENHIAAAGGISEAIRRARAYIPHTLKIEIETETVEQVQEALAAGADIIMLDNMDCDTMRQCVQLIDGKIPVEASGGVNLTTVRAIAETGVDIISVGALTHSPRSMDISMLLD